MYVAITGKGKSRVVQFCEQHRIAKTNKKKTIVIKTIGNYETLLKENPNIYKELEEKTNYLIDNIEILAKKYSVNVCVNSMGSLFTIFFVDVDKVENLEDSLKSNTENFSIYFNTMLENGIVVPPSQFEAHFLSMAHTKKELNRTLEVIEMAFKKIGEKSGK